VTAVRVPYFQDLPTILLTIKSSGEAHGIVRRLLVDSGFTGECGLLLSHADCSTFRKRIATACDVSGAIQGVYMRVWISCSIPSLSFPSTQMAIAADILELALPDGIDGLAGLSFLSLFRRWGAERDPAGKWEFVLEK